MLGQSILVVLCAGSTLLLTPVVRPANSQLATPSEATPFSYWSIKSWFLTEGKLAAVRIIPSSWGSQRSALCTHQAFFLAPLPGRRSTSARGVSRSQSLYFVFVLLSLFYSNISFHTIQLTLCFQQTGEIDNLTERWGKVSWLCCVQVPRCC